MKTLHEDLQLLLKLKKTPALHELNTTLAVKEVSTLKSHRATTERVFRTVSSELRFADASVIRLAAPPNVAYTMIGKTVSDMIGEDYSQEIYII